MLLLKYSSSLECAYRVNQTISSTLFHGKQGFDQISRNNSKHDDIQVAFMDVVTCPFRADYLFLQASFDFMLRQTAGNDVAEMI